MAQALETPREIAAYRAGFNDGREQHAKVLGYLGSVLSRVETACRLLEGAAFSSLSNSTEKPDGR